jgi:uncharacterized protein YfaP (DUF2135 family)
MAMLKPIFSGSAALAGAKKKINAAIATAVRSIATKAPLLADRQLIDPPPSTYCIISSGGMIPQRLEADGSFSHTFGFCGLSRCQGRGSK